MDRLNLPIFDISIKEFNGTNNIFDIVRRKWILLTPEEWVRQNIVHYLITKKDFPAGLISIEYQFTLGYGKKYRADIVVFDRNNKPVLVVECKAPKVKIDKETLEQVANYNCTLKAPHIFVSNGLTHFFMGTSNYINYSYSNSIPDYLSLISDKSTENI